MAITISVPTAAASSSTDGSSYAPLAAYTPQANALQVVAVYASATGDAGVMTGGGLTWSGPYHPPDITSIGSYSYFFIAQAGATPASCDPTFVCTDDNATGCAMAVLEVLGHDQANPIVQAKGAVGTAANPAFTFDAAVQTANAVVGHVGVNRTTPAYTAPSGWTEANETGHSSPNGGLELAYRASGETGTVMTWTGASGSWAALGLEIRAASGAFTLTAASGSFTLTGNATNLVSRRLSAAAGAFTLTGNAAGLSTARKISAAVGAFALTGNAVTFSRALRLTSDAGAFTLTGNAANLIRGLTLPAASGAFTLTGNAANFVYTPAGQNTLLAHTGSFVLFGIPVGFLRAQILVAEPGAFILTGNAAALTFSTLPTVSDIPTADIGPGDYTQELYRKYNLRGERPRLRKAQVKEIKRAADKPISAERLGQMAMSVLPGLPDAEISYLVANLLKQMEAALAELVALQAAADHVAGAERMIAEQSRLRERMIVNALAEYLAVLEQDELLLVHML